MYNQWFRIWRFRKYVPRAVAQEVQERVAKGKDSEVRIGGAVMNHASVQRSVNRLKAGESGTCDQEFSSAIIPGRSYC